ncbi:ferritin-like domain-containing protein [Telluribacter sp.]|jgi:hypothetical protein|uniref:ferritin-like domain-containing protein n=1 Tax=Telluribacter sp. TaxID=1978767 RepID=UPI002E0DCA17|nr:ferritin-like domain-containing protein [Telluribacter sp.]
MNLFKIIDDIQQFDGEYVDRLEYASRRSFMSSFSSKVAAAATPLAVASILNKATAQATLPQQIVDVLNFALTLEYLEAEYYIRGLNTPGLIPANTRDVFDQIRKHEVAHVEFLKSALGNKAVMKPNFDFTAKGMFPNVFSDYPTFVTVAKAFEDTGVRAYKGQAPNLMSVDAILEAALRIHSVEARHAAEVRIILSILTNNPRIEPWITLNEGVPAPVYAGEDNTTHAGVDITGIAGKSKEIITEAFDEPLSKEAVLAIVSPFIMM